MTSENELNNVTSADDDTIFGKILRKEIPTKFIFEDDLVVAFNDIEPLAPTHVIIVPKKSIKCLAEADDRDENILGRMLLVAKKMAAVCEISESYRVILNDGPNGGPSIPHLHMHLMGGRKMDWPPG